MQGGRVVFYPMPLIFRHLAAQRASDEKRPGKAGRLKLSDVGLRSGDGLAEGDRGVGHAVGEAHSLSYQDSTETKLPSMTLVWSSAMIEERGSWLKSIETFG